MTLYYVREKTKEYRSIDAAVSTEDTVYYPLEFSNTLNPASFVTYNLKLEFL